MRNQVFFKNVVVFLQKNTHSKKFLVIFKNQIKKLHSDPLLYILLACDYEFAKRSD